MSSGSRQRGASGRTGVWSRRAVLQGAAACLAGASSIATVADGAVSGGAVSDGELLGQGRFRYRARRHWGELDPARYPVKDCHGISIDRRGRIVLLTNETRNNLIAYDRTGRLLQAWEHRFPGAHGLDIVAAGGEDHYWITDHTRQLLSVCTADGRELLRIDAEALRTQYPDLSRYHPTNSAVMPDGDFYISDGYGSSYVHHFDPAGKYIASFGGNGPAPENLDTPHAVWIDSRSGKPLLLVCDRGHNAIKWFTPGGELLRAIDFGPLLQDDETIGAMPANVASFRGTLGGRFDDHLAVACIEGMVLILDGADRVVSAVGGLPPIGSDGKPRPPVNYNYTLMHPHDVCIDAAGALYVSQWGSNRTYPVKLELE